MKTKIKRMSKRSLAVFLGVVMLLTSVGFGSLLTTNAAYTRISSVGATTDYYWNYQKDMPSGNYSAGNHQALTQSSKATNKYYYIATLDTSSTYGMYMSYGGYGQNDKHYKPNSDFDAESNAAYKLTDKGVNNNYGNTSNREKYATNSSDTQYIVTWDSTQNELYMSPTSAGVELRWDVQTGHTNYYNLDHTETMTQAADGYTYTCDVSLTGGTAYYLFNKVGQYYYRGTSTLTTGSFVQVYSYGKDNYGGSADKLSYTPATTGTYRFTWDNRDKTLSVALASASTSTYSLTGDIWSSCITQINGSTNSITRGEGVDDAIWWGEYHAGAAVNTATGTAGVYTIDITTADRATLVAGNPTFTTIDIGLYNNSENKQKAFKVGDTYYNYIGGDYKVTSAGLTDADIVDLAASNGGGSLQLQPGRSYRITVNENTSKISVAEINHVDKYFLAGQYTGGVAQFFGSTWNTSNNELTYNSTSGCYEKTFTTNIPAGTINFKVVKNGDSDGWDGGSWPAENQSYVIKANATSVTFTFDPSTHTTTVTQTNSGGGETASTVNVYAKSGSLRNENTTMGSMAASVIQNTEGTPIGTEYNPNSENWNGGNAQFASVKKGKSFKVQTTIKAAYKADYYVKGFDVNGETYGLITQAEADFTNGVYTVTIPIDVETTDEKIEVTPIIYKKDDTTTRFYIEGYDDVPSTEGWGSTLYVYPFYGNLDGADNAFKAYPGQPVINEGGKRYIDIPDSISSTDIKGVTLSNGYWDTAHRTIQGWNESNANHKQTYDYDDFYKIKKEVPAVKELKNIIFYYKYEDGFNGSRTDLQDAGGNQAPATFTTVATSTWKNGWEPLTDYYGRYVDIFGNVLADQSTEPTPDTTSVIHVVSNGYVYNNAGYFGTEWNVYKYESNKYTRKAQISPSALLMKSAASFAAYSGNKWSDYKTAYTALKTADYLNKPVVITYENVLFGGVKPTGGEDKAVRNDGRWYATYEGDTINANIKIQYTGGGVTGWQDDTFQNTNQGGITGAKAYFTNESVNTSSGTATINEKVEANNVLLSDDNFTFRVDNSKLNPAYKFVGWVRVNGTTESNITKSINGSSSMSSSDTYIARYRFTGAATVKVSHTLLPTSALGNTEVSAVVTHENNQTETFENAQAVNGVLSIPMITSDKSIVVTLGASSIGENKFRGFYTGTSESDVIAGTDSNEIEATTKTTTITINKSDVFNSNDTPKKESFYYYSNFDNVNETLTVTYTYKDRFNQDKTYTAKRTVDAKFLEAYKGADDKYGLNNNIIVNDMSNPSDGSFTIREWIQNTAPRVDDLDNVVTWDMNNITHTKGTKVYSMTGVKTAKRHKVQISFNKNGSPYSEVLEVDDDSFTNNSKLLGYGYNDASSDFKYWDVYSAERDSEGNLTKKLDTKPYARCYNRFFSLTIPEDSWIEAVYESTGDSEIAGIREPVYTREVYNVVDGETITNYDYVYADFIVNYLSEKYVQLNDYNGDGTKDTGRTDYKTGVIMEFNQNVSIDDNAEASISGKTFNSDTSTLTGDNLTTFITDGKFANNKNYITYTAGGNTGKNAAYYYAIDNKDYNDFNRYDYFLKFTNSNTWRKRVMKAYYYVVKPDGVVLSDPVYFAINVIGNSEATITTYSAS